VGKLIAVPDEPDELALSPELVIRAYCAGAFPMARQRDGGGGIDWFSPHPRALLPLDERFRVRRSLAKRVRQRPFRISRDAAFDRVIRACAESRPGADQTWISQDIIAVYGELHEMGLAHSVEAFEGDGLVGGLYGVALGGAYFGESMFSRRPDASQICLVHLVKHLRSRGYHLLDVQFSNPHLEQFGVYEVPREQYLRQLHEALSAEVSWEGGG